MRKGKMTPTEEYFKSLGCKWERIPNSSLSGKEYSKWGWYLHFVLVSTPSEVHKGEVKPSEACAQFPDILDSFTQLKKWVIDKMGAEGAFLTKTDFYIHWVFSRDNRVKFSEKVVNGDIPLAMIKSATRYWESKK